MTLRIVFAGTPEVAVPSLRALIASNHRVVGVLSRPDAPAGRGRRLHPSPVSDAAREAGLDLSTPASPAQIRDELVRWTPDVVAVVAYGVLIPADLLNLPRLGWVNAHFSALPRWRGAAPVQYAIAHGDDTIAVTTFRIDEGLDTGPILLRSAPIDIGPREDAGSLLERLSTIAAGLVVETMDGLARGELQAVPQSPAGVSMAPRIRVDDARIDWTRPVDVVDRWIRACTPAPGAWTIAGDVRVRIAVPQELRHDPAAVPGEIIAEKSRVLVGAQGGHLVLGAVQSTGGRWMPAPDWARGLRERLPRRFDP